MARIAVIGVTGGIACGKSTVTARMREHGIPVIDADLVARDVVRPDQPCLMTIRRVFGEAVIQSDGTLDRKRLGAIVFSDPAQLQQLNQITHPAILKQVEETTAAYGKSGARWVVYDAALIIENGLSPMLDKLVVVLCEPEIQLHRLMARDHITESEALDRIAKQTTNRVRRERGDFIIENNGTLEDLRQAADALVLKWETGWE